MGDDLEGSDSGDSTTMVMPEDHISPGTPDVELAPETIIPEGRTKPDPNDVDNQSEVHQAIGDVTDHVAQDAQEEPTSPWANVDLEPGAIFSPGNVDP